MEEFLRYLPKIELHAHLNGSLSTKSMKELNEKLCGKITPDFLHLCEQFTEGTDLEDVLQKFKIMHQLTATKEGLELATDLVIRDFALDGVAYLELRTTPKANEHMSKREYLETVLYSINEAKTRYPDVRVKLLLSIDRGQSVSAAEETLDLILELRQLDNFKHFIKGIDLSGNPSCGSFKKFAPVLSNARKNGLKLALHCAEIDNPAEVEEMLAFGMDRCGHGTWLNNLQIMQLSESNTAIECCLTSNVKCKTVVSYDDHHFRNIFTAAKAIAVICTDDCGVFNTTLTHEFELATEIFQLRKDDIRLLTLNAIDHAFAEESEKSCLRTRVENYFETHK